VMAVAVAAEGEPWREAVWWQSSGDDVKKTRKEITSTKFFFFPFVGVSSAVRSNGTISLDLKTYSL
jgi:hypothetical protein